MALSGPLSCAANVGFRGSSGRLRILPLLRPKTSRELVDDLMNGPTMPQDVVVNAYELLERRIDIEKKMLATKPTRGLSCYPAGVQSKSDQPDAQLRLRARPASERWRRSEPLTLSAAGEITGA